MKEAVESAMREYRQLEDSGERKAFFDSVRAGWPDWYFLHGRRYYPVKAIWAKATGEPSPFFQTRDAKRGLKQDGFGAFVNLTLQGRGLEYPPDLGLSDLDEQSGGLGGGESDAHRLLKEWISENPAIIGFSDHQQGLTEVPLPSGDRIDVVFVNDSEVVAVEVKPIFYDLADLNRGIFQCVKYKAVLKALEKLGSRRSVRTKLVIGGILPEELQLKVSKLSIDIFDNAQTLIANSWKGGR